MFAAGFLLLIPLQYANPPLSSAVHKGKKGLDTYILTDVSNPLTTLDNFQCSWTSSELREFHGSFALPT